MGPEAGPRCFRGDGLVGELFAFALRASLERGREVVISFRLLSESKSSLFFFFFRWEKGYEKVIALQGAVAPGETESLPEDDLQQLDRTCRRKRELRHVGTVPMSSS